MLSAVAACGCSICRGERGAGNSLDPLSIWLSIWLPIWLSTLHSFVLSNLRLS